MKRPLSVLKRFAKLEEEKEGVRGILSPAFRLYLP